jgi:hypothetical protein
MITLSLVLTLFGPLSLSSFPFDLTVFFSPLFDLTLFFSSPSFGLTLFFLLLLLVSRTLDCSFFILSAYPNDLTLAPACAGTAAGACAASHAARPVPCWHQVRLSCRCGL